MEGHTDLGSIFLVYERNTFCGGNDPKSLMLKAAHHFEDTELITFIEKYYESAWFCSTVQYIQLQHLSDIVSNRLGDENALNFLSTLGGSPSFIKYMIQNGVDINFVSQHSGNTPLLRALRYGNYDTVKMLLDAGANPWCKNDKGESALEVAFTVCSEQTFLLMFDAIIQTKPKESELLDCFSLGNPCIKIHIKRWQGDRTMLKMTYRLHKYWNNTFVMTPGEVGYLLGILANDDDLFDEKAPYIKLWLSDRKVLKTILPEGIRKALYSHKRANADVLTLFSIWQKTNIENEVEAIHAILRQLYRLKFSEIIWHGLFFTAPMVKAMPKLLNLYATYLHRLGEDFSSILQ